MNSKLLQKVVIIYIYYMYVFYIQYRVCVCVSCFCDSVLCLEFITHSLWTECWFEVTRNSQLSTIYLGFCISIYVILRDFSFFIWYATLLFFGIKLTVGFVLGFNIKRKCSLVFSFVLLVSFVYTYVYILYIVRFTTTKQARHKICVALQKKKKTM